MEPFQERDMERDDGEVAPSPLQSAENWPRLKGRTMCYWRKICEKIKYLEIKKRYGHAVSGILKVYGSPLKKNY